MVQLRVEVDSHAIDLEELEALTHTLRHDLLALDINQVDQPQAAGPAGNKSSGAGAVGTLLLTFAGTPELLEAIVLAVHGWCGRNRQRTVRLELDGDSLELSRASATDQRRLVDQWIAWHAHR